MLPDARAVDRGRVTSWKLAYREMVPDAHPDAFVADATLRISISSVREATTLLAREERGFGRHGCPRPVPVLEDNALAQAHYIRRGFIRDVVSTVLHLGAALVKVRLVCSA